MFAGVIAPSLTLNHLLHACLGGGYPIPTLDTLILPPNENHLLIIFLFLFWLLFEGALRRVVNPTVSMGRFRFHFDTLLSGDARMQR